MVCHQPVTMIALENNMYWSKEKKRVMFSKIENGLRVTAKLQGCGFKA